MDTQNEYIIRLLHQYINNKCNEQELRSLIEWLKSGNDYSCFDSIAEPLWKDICQKSTHCDERHIQELEIEVTHLLKRMQPQRSVTAPVTTRPLQKKRWFKVAAVAMLVITMALGALNLSQDDSPSSSYVEVMTQKGERKTHTLPDGSQITLNSNTQIRIPGEFNQKNRRIQMTGEAFFKVAPNKAKPFIIENNGGIVTVLGTSFDVKSYGEDGTFNVTVSTGKVRVAVESLDLQLSLTPNEHLTINKNNGTISKETFTENNYIKWMKGILYFNKTPIREVINTINRTYSKKVVLQCNNCDWLITGMHNNKSLDDIVEAICYTTGLQSRRQDNQIIIYK